MTNHAAYLASILSESRQARRIVAATCAMGPARVIELPLAFDEHLASARLWNHSRLGSSPCRLPLKLSTNSFCHGQRWPRSFGQRRAAGLIRSLIRRTRMEPFPVAQRDAFADEASGMADRLIRFRAGLFILDAAPHPPDEHVTRCLRTELIVYVPTSPLTS